MTNEMCKRINCKCAGKFSGKAVCRFGEPKQFLKHMTACPLVLNNKS